MPYIYSLGWYTHKTGAPFMRALFMDFPNDPKVDEIGDEYMFGPAFLVAPVYLAGPDHASRSICPPALTGTTTGRTPATTADKPSPWLHPLTVCRSSSAPDPSFPWVARSPARKTTRPSPKSRSWPGRNASFTLYRDDGTTYAYEHGDYKVTHLHWDQQTQKLTHTGAPAWTAPDSQVVDVIH